VGIDPIQFGMIITFALCDRIRDAAVRN